MHSVTCCEVSQHTKEASLNDARPHALAARSGDVALPGGGVEAGETDLEAAVRECREEVGLDLTKGGFEVLGQLDDRVRTTAAATALLICSRCEKGRAGSPRCKEEAACPLRLSQRRPLGLDYALSRWRPPTGSGRADRREGASLSPRSCSSRRRLVTATAATAAWHPGPRTRPWSPSRRRWQRRGGRISER